MRYSVVSKKSANSYRLDLRRLSAESEAADTGWACCWDTWQLDVPGLPKNLTFHAIGKAIYKVCTEVMRFSAVLRGEVPVVFCLLAVSRMLVV